MKCPKCKAEVPEWHFYCQNCHIQIHDYKPEAERPPLGRIERAGARVLNALVGLSIIAVLVLTGRAVQWSELFAAIRGDTSVSAESRLASKESRSTRARSTEGRREDEPPTDVKAVEASGREKKDVVESVRAMPQKIEELSSVEDSPHTLSLKPSAAAPKVHKPEDVPATAAPASTLKPAAQQTGQAGADAQLSIEQIDPKNSGETGLVAIKSYTPARIYINGQFSGLTPRIVKLIAGDHQIRLIADGYEDWTRRVRLKAKQQVGIMASMKKKSEDD